MMRQKCSRRRFLKTSAVVAAGSAVGPFLGCGKVGVTDPMKRILGKTGFEVTTLGLGGQASLQWTPEGIEPAAIIVKAIQAGVNYLDTSNVYGPSQKNFGAAFRALDLVPGLANYDEKARRSLYLASKTMLRYSKGTDLEGRGWSEGAAGTLAVDDLKRTLSQIFGDGSGAYPEGAYLDLLQIHNLNTIAEVDSIYEGLDKPDPTAERLGTLAALVDFRDGTNRTGLNPNEEKLIRHIGITGHFSSPVMMECLQRDEHQIIDTMLIAINANDRRYLSHQYNAIPVAKARNVGMIAMKVFADGAMYTKEPRWSRTPEDVVRVVGTPELPSRPLIEYALTTPGIGTAIIGIGQISSDDRMCQLTQNLSAAQIAEESFSETDRAEIEGLALKARGGQTNWFQVEQQPLGPPREAEVLVENRDGKLAVRLSWQTAYAADEPIEYYEIHRDGQAVGRLEHQPQTTKAPFVYEDVVEGVTAAVYQVVTVDRAARTAASEAISVKLA